MVKRILFLVLLLVIVSCNSNQEERKTTAPKQINIENPTNKIGLSKNIDFIDLNPARGDQSPQAGAVYGDIRKAVPTGYIGKFVDGFSAILCSK